MWHPTRGHIILVAGQLVFALNYVYPSICRVFDKWASTASFIYLVWLRNLIRNLPDTERILSHQATTLVIYWYNWCLQGYVYLAKMEVRKEIDLIEAKAFCQILSIKHNNFTVTCILNKILFKLKRLFWY